MSISKFDDGQTVRASLLPDKPVLFDRVPHPFDSIELRMDCSSAPQRRVANESARFSGAEPMFSIRFGVVATIPPIDARVIV
jgi:hypothetical protein